MSEKRTCPGCGSHTSEVLREFAAGEPCPSCGLSAAAANEIESVRSARADEKLKARCEELVRTNSELTTENDDLRSRLGVIREAVEGRYS